MYECRRLSFQKLFVGWINILVLFSRRFLPLMVPHSQSVPVSFAASMWISNSTYSTLLHLSTHPQGMQRDLMTLEPSFSTAFLCLHYWPPTPAACLHYSLKKLELIWCGSLHRPAWRGESRLQIACLSEWKATGFRQAVSLKTSGCYFLTVAVRT